MKKTSGLASFMNIGQATLKDLHLLGIYTAQELAQQSPHELYTRLEKLTGHHHDVCVWDVFAAAIHEAKTGEKTVWWSWTPLRKQLQQTQPLCPHDTRAR